MLKSIFTKFIPPPRIIDIPYAGLDITDDAVHLIFFSPARSSFFSGKKILKIAYFAARPLSSGMIEDGFIKDEAGVKAILEGIVKEVGPLRVRASLPEEKVYLFKTDLPSDNEKEIRQNIESKIEENVPVSLPEALFDIEQIHCRPKQGTDQAVVSVAPRKVVNAYLNLIASSGMIPIAFELQAKALTRALVPKCAPETYLIVHSVEKKTGLSIICDGVVSFTSTVEWGKNNLCQVISTSLSVTLDEAEKMKKEAQIHGGEKLAKIVSLIESTVTPLTDEIHRVYAYWLEHGGDNKEIKKVIFSGADAELISSASNIPSSLGLSFSVADVWKNAFLYDEYVPPIKREDAFEYATAIGLALPQNNN